MKATRFSAVLLAVGIALGLIWNADAQQRALQGTTLRLTDTTANALLVGCAVGSTNCIGGVKAGTFSFVRSGISTIRDGALGTTAGVELHIRPSAGKKGYITLAEDTIADRWSIGTENGDSKLYFRSGVYTDTVDASLDSDGTLTHAGAMVHTGAQNATTGDSTNEITLTSTTYMLRITTGGTATNDDIAGFIGGTAGRELAVCWVSQPGSTGTLRFMSENVAATAANRLKLYTDPLSMSGFLESCIKFIYDGTTSRWRLLNI